MSGKGKGLICWNPPKIWKDGTAYIIGGGPSLSDMEWDKYTDRHFIGVNDAYMLGDWVDMCFFGDWGWFKSYHWKDEVVKPECVHKGLRQYPNPIVTNCWRHASEIKDMCPHIKLFKRGRKGFGHPPYLSWHGNSGISATNLAIILGAKTIVLLGFDCDDKAKEVNWHTNLKNPQRLGTVYKKFKSGFADFKKEVEEFDDSIDIINANPESKLEMFPKMKRSDAMKL